METERDGPVRDAQAAVEKQAQRVRNIFEPFGQAFAEWGRNAMRAAPGDEPFAEYVQAAIQEIGGMSLEPLGSVIEAIEVHQRKIEKWRFAEKPKNGIPMFRLQDAVSA